ncbi:helix-turn-helix domain-containing protein [Nocardia sp. CC227C]|uniref:helix-turn-helix domain-containing protein n=1 Tax=Nocardia sp. CC227C TaxID=3044562 RepID=UPI00278C8282|nr:helix-turn-helix domain-containing protein [Nocardia sp. CC227C]
MAARRLAAEQGLDATTTDDIAKAVGVSPRTFFNYYETKLDAVVGPVGEIGTPEARTEFVGRTGQQAVGVTGGGAQRRERGGPVGRPKSCRKPAYRRRAGHTRSDAGTPRHHERLDTAVEVPWSGPARVSGTSLNVAVAVSLVLYKLAGLC